MLLTLALLTALHTAPAADSVAGTWQIKGDVAGNPLNTICTVAQTADSLSGSCDVGNGQPFPLSGVVKDGKVTIQHGGDYQGQELTIVYSGTLTSAKKIEGTVEVQPFGATGTFTAAPAPATPATPAPAPAPAPAKP